MTYIYLATPYSKFSGGIEAAYKAACDQAALFVQAGVPVFCPIAHTHGMATHGMLDPLDHETWLDADRPFMDAAKALVVCMLPGWEESYGVECEMKHFAAAGKTTYLMTPGQIPTELLPKQRSIIGLTGYARSGKDEAAKALNWTRVAFADAVRDALLALDPIVDCINTEYCDDRLVRLSSEVNRGWTSAKKDPEVRRLLQRLGTEAGRNIHGADCWIKIAHRKVEAAPGNVVITDVRFANEADAIRSWGGKVIRIERRGVGPCNIHSSEELALDVDAVIENDGTIEDLHNKVRELAQDMEAVA